MSERIVLEKRCTPQTKLFLAARRDEELVEALSRTLCSSAAMRENPSGFLLASAILGFIVANGVESELSMRTFGYMLSLANESVEESALDSMFRQVEKGEYYDLEQHKWVDDPRREPQPHLDYIVAYRRFKEEKAPERARTIRLLRLSYLRIGEYPGWDYLCAALLESRVDGDGCPIRRSCKCYLSFMSRLSRAMSTALSDCPSGHAGSSQVYVSKALEYLNEEARTCAVSGERMRLGGATAPEGASSLSESVAGRPLRRLRTPFCPEAEADLASAKRMLGLGGI